MTIEPDLKAAYLDTDYFVSDDPPLLLRVGENNPDLQILLASFGVSSAAFLTAWNPGSKVLGEAENDARQAELLTDIEALRLNYLVGHGERQDWLEHSYLILGASFDEANQLATKYEQAAYLWITDSGLPELIIMDVD